jgi:hypothetical protein
MISAIQHTAFGKAWLAPAVLLSMRPTVLVMLARGDRLRGQRALEVNDVKTHL